MQRLLRLTLVVGVIASGYLGTASGSFPSFPTIRIQSPSQHGYSPFSGLGLGGGSAGEIGGWGGLKGFKIPSDLADKLFPFTIRIATNGEPHLPVLRVGPQPYALAASFWGRPGGHHYPQPHSGYHGGYPGYHSYPASYHGHHAVTGPYVGVPHTPHFPW